MFRQESTSFPKWELRLGQRFIPKLAALALLLLSALALFPADADARRRYYHHQGYSAPAAAMAIDLHTGRVLYSKNAAELRYPASLTKVMTLFLLFDALRDGKISMTSQLRVSAHAADQSPTKLDLSEGDAISVADAVGAIVTKSANDMAVTIAEALAGSEEEFARRMTQKARSIGMINTTFRNASGLPDAEQKTTAEDLIVLGKSILASHPDRAKVFATKYFQYDGQIFRNHNTLLFSYEGMEGMKTGFTSAAGFNLIATARRNDKRLLAVVLGGSSPGSRNAAMRSILDNAWGKALTQTAARKAGILVAAIKPKSDDEPPAAKPEKSAAAAIGQAPAPVLARAPAFQGSYSRLRRRPDRTSISILLASIEAGLVTKPHSTSAQTKPAVPVAVSPDIMTDEPEEREEREASRAAGYVPPAPQDISRNVTLVALVQRNVSVHYKTVRVTEETPLDAAVLDPMPEAATAKPVQPVRSVKSEVEPLRVAPVQAEAEPRDVNRPGPFHIQVGAFPDREKAKERLESVKEALGAAMLQAHPEFIVPVTMPSGGVMFRARLSRFGDEAQAKAACKRLKKSGIECWDIRAE